MDKERPRLTSKGCSGPGLGHHEMDPVRSPLSKNRGRLQRFLKIAVWRCPIHPQTQKLFIIYYEQPLLWSAVQRVAPLADLSCSRALAENQYMSSADAMTWKEYTLAIAQISRIDPQEPPPSQRAL